MKALVPLGISNAFSQSDYRAAWQWDKFSWKRLMKFKNKYWVSFFLVSCGKAFSSSKDKSAQFPLAIPLFSFNSHFIKWNNAATIHHLPGSNSQYSLVLCNPSIHVRVSIWICILIYEFIISTSFLRILKTLEWKGTSTLSFFQPSFLTVHNSFAIYLFIGKKSLSFLLTDLLQSLQVLLDT